MVHYNNAGAAGTFSSNVGGGYCGSVFPGDDFLLSGPGTMNFDRDL